MGLINSRIIFTYLKKFSKEITNDFLARKLHVSAKTINNFLAKSEKGYWMDTNRWKDTSLNYQVDKEGILVPLQDTLDNQIVTLFDVCFEKYMNSDLSSAKKLLEKHFLSVGISKEKSKEFTSLPDFHSIARKLELCARYCASESVSFEENLPEDNLTEDNLHDNDNHIHDNIGLYTFFDLQSHWTALEISEQLIKNDHSLYPEEALVYHGGTAKIWSEHIIANPENWMFLCDRSTKRIIGNWSFAFVTPEQEATIQTGNFMEGEFTVGKTQDALSTAPNGVAIYLLNISANNHSEDNHLKLWRSFAERIQALACKGIFIKGIYANVLTPEEEAMFISKSFKRIDHNSGGGEVYFLDLSSGCFPETFSYIIDLDLEKHYYNYWRSQFKCKQLTSEDDLSEQQERDLARLIWETDPYIYPAMCSEEQAEKLLPLLFDDDPMFNKNNLFCGFIGDKIIGLILHHKGPLYWTADLLREECESLPDTLNKVEKDYFSEYQRTSTDTRSIINCCINSRWRMRGIRLGSEMMQQFLQEHPGENMELFVLEETPAAYKLYRRAGFKKVYKCNGFSIDNRDLPCYFMQRAATE